MEQEIWKDVKNYEGFYQISNYGRVLSLKRTIQYSKNDKVFFRIKKSKIMNIKDNKGYNFITFTKNNIKKNFRVCRLVAIHFIENKDNKPTVNHIDGNKKNDKFTNLEWNTYFENNMHAIKNNLRPKIKREEDKRCIKLICIDKGITFNSILEASLYAKCHQSHLSRMLRGIYKNKTTLRFLNA